MAVSICEVHKEFQALLTGLGYLRLRKGEGEREEEERDLNYTWPMVSWDFPLTDSDEGRDEEEPAHSVPPGKFPMLLSHWQTQPANWLGN